jgi:polysaccharide biosynthesis/export protein
MRKFLQMIVFTITLIIISAGTAWAQEYTLGSDDVLNISVYGYQELHVTVIVRPDGKIAFPLVGEVQAAGLSPGALSAALTSSLSEYVKNPKVTINVDKFRTTRVYVLGQVAKPGIHEIQKQHNLLDAIGMAGGFTKDTAKKNIFIIHKDKPNQVTKVNLLKLLERGDLTQNVALADGDVVYLTKNHKIVFSRDILPYITAAYQVNEVSNISEE